jgi:hypothetical protein
MLPRRFHARVLAACCLLPLVTTAAPHKVELAGNPLGVLPYFEYVRAFNANTAVNVAIDPTRFPAISGHTCNIFVVAHKSASGWVSSPALVDVTPGGAVSHLFNGATIQANTVQVAAASTLNANAGAGLGVPYDVVFDCDANGLLSDADYIDGLGGEAGLYMVNDTSALGPHAVTHVTYELDSTVAASFGIPGDMLGEDLFFPTNVASMGKLPLVVLGHGNTHYFTWYDHIGTHLASHGYVVVSHENNITPGPVAAAGTTLGHTDAFIDQAAAGAIASGALAGHIDAHRIVWIGHSRGGEGVAIAYDQLFDGTAMPAPVHYNRHDVRLISSMLPTDTYGTDIANPHDANYHLWTASGDWDVLGSADCNGCQTFHLAERATGYKQSTIVQGTGHGWFHNGPGDAEFLGSCAIGRAQTHQVQLGYLLPLIQHYVEDNVPALDFLTRQYERFRPMGVSSVDPCVVVTNEYRNGAAVGNFVIDDYQAEDANNLSSSGGSVTFNVENLTEGRLDDGNTNFTWAASDPFNGATQDGPNDTGRGVVFDWTGTNRFYQWQVVAGGNDFSRFKYLSFRGAQGTNHPNTLFELGDLTFTVTLLDGSGGASHINIGAYGGGLEEPFERSQPSGDFGWHNEMETVRLRTTDFANNGSGIDLGNIVAVRLDVGPSFGSSSGRIVIDDLMLTSDLSPRSFTIIEPSMTQPTFAGSSVTGSPVLVRLSGAAQLDVSPANLAISVDGVPLSPAQIPVPATQVAGETWAVISPGPKPKGCYAMTATLTTPTGIAAIEPQSLCYADDETHAFDRVLAIDQTNSMNFDGTTGLSSPAKMEAAKAAAKFFVDLSNPIDQIGVISFQRRDQDGDGTIVDPDELAEPQFSLVAAGEGANDQRPAARAAIDHIFPDTSPGFFGPETSAGAGLVEARDMLNAVAMPGHTHNIVLLTDGLENYPPFWTAAGPGGPLQPDFAAGTVRVDTLGIGQDADDELLQDMAAQTGGEFRNLNEGSGSFFLLSRMADYFKSIDESMRGEQRFFYAEGLPEKIVQAGSRIWHAGYFDVEPSLDWMTVAFHSDQKDAVSVQLLPPGASAPLVIAPPGTTLRVDSRHSVYRVRAPKAGRWQYLVSTRGRATEFFAVASAPTSLVAKLVRGDLRRSAGGVWQIPLHVWIADRQSVRGASVSGYVRAPDGKKSPLRLIEAGNSVYGLDFAAKIPGAYYIHLEASGLSNSGAAFTRRLSTSIIVPGQRKRNPQPGERR